MIDECFVECGGVVGRDCGGGDGVDGAGGGAVGICFGAAKICGAIRRRGIDVAAAGAAADGGGLSDFDRAGAAGDGRDVAVPMVWVFDLDAGGGGGAGGDDRGASIVLHAGAGRVWRDGSGVGGHGTVVGGDAVAAVFSCEFADGTARGTGGDSAGVCAGDGEFGATLMVFTWQQGHETLPILIYADYEYDNLGAAWPAVGLLAVMSLGLILLYNRALRDGEK